MSRRGDPRVFAKNLKLLTFRSGMTSESAAEGISRKLGQKISPRWYRTLCTMGVGQSHRRTEEKLQAIAKHFGLRTLNQLWEPDLILFKLSSDFVPPIHAEYSVMFSELLRSGKHDYLRDLVVRLHESEFGPGAGPGGDHHSEGEVDRFIRPRESDDDEESGRKEMDDENDPERLQEEWGGD